MFPLFPEAFPVHGGFIGNLFAIEKLLGPAFKFFHGQPVFSLFVQISTITNPAVDKIHVLIIGAPQQGHLFFMPSLPLLSKEFQTLSIFSSVSFVL